MKKKGKRIIGYCRESTATQFNEGFNIDDQEKRIRSYADIYFNEEDELMIMKDAASAKDLDRLNMSTAIDMMNNKEVDVFVVYSLDRMTRRVKDLAYLLDVFQKNNVQLLSISERIDTKSAVGRFFIFLIVLIAQWEQDTIASRTERGVLESAMQGNYAKAGSPIGYMRNPADTHKLIINPETADIVQYVFNEVTVNSMPINTVMHKLNSISALGKTWSASTVSNMVHNKIYYGTMELKGRDFPNIAPPLITRDVYETAQLKTKTSSRVRGRQYLFRSYVRCPDCDRIMATRTATHKNGKEFKYYICSKCHSQISEKIVIEQVKDSFTRLIRQEQFENDIRALEESCSSAAQMIQDLPMSFFLYGMDRDYVQRLINEKTENKDMIEKNVDRLQAGLAEIQFENLSYSQVRDFLAKYVQMIDVDSSSKRICIKYININSN